MGLAGQAGAVSSKLDGPLQLARDRLLKARSSLRAQGLPAAQAFPLVDVFIRLAPGVGPGYLESAYPGLSVRTAVEDVVTAFAPLDMLVALEGDPRVVRASLSQRLALRMNVARSSAAFESGSLYGGVLEAGLSDLSGVDGSGVVVGVLDSGIDWRNADFYDPDALGSRSSRVAFLWDQTISSHTQGPFPPGYAYGAQYTRAQFSSKLNGGADDIRTQDTNGHGTHVAGIAAADGSATNGREPAGTYTGLAPKADLVIVKSDLQNSAIVDGVNYIIARARSLGKRAVINLSLGGQSGPHDGTDEFETAIAALAASTPVIVAMGNEGNLSPHARATFAASETKVFTVSTAEVPAAAAMAGVEFWHAGGDRYTLTVSLTCAPACPGTFVVASGTNSTGAIGAVAVAVSNAANIGHPRGDKQIQVQISSMPAAVTALNCQFTRTANSGSGVVDGFTSPDNGTKFTTFVDNTMTIGEPASAANVIAVGAYNTKKSWVDYDGNTQEYSTPPVLGDIADFSSRGPTRDNRTKPAVAAPGQAIGASFSTFKSTDSNTLYDGFHTASQGTSQATPLVTGFVALKLQVMPSAVVSEIAADISAGARTDAKVTAAGAAPNNVWGSGKLAGAPKVRLAPAGFQGAAAGTSSVAWTWSLTRNATAYNVYHATDTSVLIASTASAGFTWTGLLTNTTYGISVKAANPIGEGPGSASPVRSTLAAAPTASPLGAVSLYQIALSWDAHGNPDGTLYEAQVSSTDFATAATSATLATSATFQALLPGTAYSLRVRAFNRDSVATDFAPTVSTRTAPAPGAPALTGKVVSSTTVRWSWTSTGTVTGFDIHYATGGLLASLSSSASFYLENDLSTGTSSGRYVVARCPEAEAPSSTRTVVMPAQGAYIQGTSVHTLSGRDGKVRLSIPAALLGDTTGWLLSDSPLEEPLESEVGSLVAAAGAPAGMRSSTASLTEFLLEVDEGEVSTGTLSVPVTVSVPYSDAVTPGFVDGVSPPIRVETLQLFTLDEETEEWDLVPDSRVDTVNKVVTGDVSHLSLFTAFGMGGMPGLAQVRVYPIPYRPNGGNPDQGKPYSSGDPTSGIIFDNLPDSVTIDIYTLTGRRVASLSTEDSSGRLAWDARNDSGRDAASGGYLAVITSPGAPKLVKKLLIIR